MIWQLAEAKNKFSEVMTRALTEGPQRITRRNQTVVVISQEDHDRLSGARMSFKDFLLSAPDMSDLDLECDRSQMREVDFEVQLCLGLKRAEGPWQPTRPILD